MTKREHKLDYEVKTDEVESAIYLLEIGKSPGADSHFPELFKFAGENLIEAIRTMVNLPLKHGWLPQEWKTANIKFLRKQGKTNYYSPSSYRPISLTNVTCKITERIVLNRLAAFIEGTKLIEEKQEGFRKKHSTSNCLMRFIQNTIEKFNKGEITLACLIDLEKAYDSIWREGLISEITPRGIFAQIRTGYTEFNFYKNRVGQTNAIESFNCRAPETPHHSLMECPCYENEREEMFHQISKEVGIRNLNLATMLTRLDGENIEETKAKLQTVAHYIDRTGRFDTAVPQSQS
ncbi:unnamed protein product [Mytilus coruscus]|uniref:Reverse transcriptase domain-containing protein n=1 Tax=Mytilus coruscus TaxID=42192 RepID=A0A6J8CGG8_MYTCO|nr:unnamed protein product [Mytilus coruscus]